MFRKMFAISLSASFVFGMLILKSLTATTGSSTAAPFAQADTRGLASTLMFSVYSAEQKTPDPNEANAYFIERDREDSLGTVITIDGQPAILTHDHWSLDNSKWVEVVISRADGSHLLTMPVDSFRALILFRDGGTMVVKLPAALHSLVQPAPTLTSNMLPVGTSVTVIYRQPGARVTATAQTAVVTGIEMHKGLPTYILRSSTGQAILPGDSGGGIFLNDKLVGNNWTTVMQTVVEEKGFLGLTWNESQEVHDSSRAAALGLTMLETAGGRLVTPETPTTTAMGPG